MNISWIMVGICWWDPVVECKTLCSVHGSSWIQWMSWAKCHPGSSQHSDVNYCWCSKCHGQRTALSSKEKFQDTGDGVLPCFAMFCHNSIRFPLKHIWKGWNDVKWIETVDVHISTRRNTFPKRLRGSILVLGLEKMLILLFSDDHALFSTILSCLGASDWASSFNLARGSLMAWSVTGASFIVLYIANESN